MKTGLFFLILTATLMLTGCSHYGMHHYYNAMEQNQAGPSIHFPQSSDSMEPDGDYLR